MKIVNLYCPRAFGTWAIFAQLREIRLTIDLDASHYLYNISQCSTVVRNTVVRATIRVNGKPPILGTRSPLTPQSIELKFDTGDYVGGGTPHAKNGKSRPPRAGPVKD